MSVSDFNIHVYQKVQKELHYSVFSKSGKKDIRKHWKISLVLHEIYRGKNILAYFLACETDCTSTSSLSTIWVGIGIHVVRAKVLTICPYSYCQYDSMVYNQALLTEAFQVLYFNSHPTPIYIHFLQVDFLEEVKFARF